VTKILSTLTKSFLRLPPRGNLMMTAPIARSPPQCFARLQSYPLTLTQSPRLTDSVFYASAHPKRPSSCRKFAMLKIRLGEYCGHSLNWNAKLEELENRGCLGWKKRPLNVFWDLPLCLRASGEHNRVVGRCRLGKRGVNVHARKKQAKKDLIDATVPSDTYSR
jgi:hypothetical protein